ncbi:MAG: transposase, partial [Fimbriimonadaceae bacterium]|nr:transposase [Fimbriimonadaceae bacterium]
MTKNKFSAEQVVRLLKEAESGERTVTDICRERGITKNTFYAW